MKYSPFEIEEMLGSMTILVDTREQPNKKFLERTQGFNRPWERQKLNFGDYSAKYKGLDGNWISLADSVAIERKMDANELALCFGKDRPRFEREFQRAKEVGAKIYLIVEDENWEKVYLGKYGNSSQFRSKLNPKSLVGSILAWQARYKLNLQFCDEATTGPLIADILHYELRELLEHGEQKNVFERGCRVRCVSRTFSLSTSIILSIEHDS